MPLLRPDEIRKMKAGRRRERLKELRDELLRLRTMVKAGGSVENPRRIREIKRAIARILTIEEEEKRRQ